jgi:sortase A
MNTRRIVTFGALTCTLLGALLLGNGAYIYAKAQLAQTLLQHAWARTLAGEHNVKPWPWADTWPVARLRSLEHDIDIIVLAGDSGRVLAFGPGHHFGSALPTQPGHSLISAHRDTHFHFLKDVALNEELQLQNTQGEWHRYRVVETRVLDAHDVEFAQLIQPSALTLITCYPFDALLPGGPLRFVLTALEV